MSVCVRAYTPGTGMLNQRDRHRHDPRPHPITLLLLFPKRVQKARKKNATEKKEKKGKDLFEQCCVIGYNDALCPRPVYGFRIRYRSWRNLQHRSPRVCLAAGSRPPARVLGIHLSISLSWVSLVVPRRPLFARGAKTTWSAICDWRHHRN